MLIITILLYFIMAVYSAVLIYEAIETKGRFTGIKRQAIWTVYLFFLTDVIIIVGGLVEYHIVAEINLVVSAIGCFLLITKIFLKRWAMKSLGEHYNVHIVVILVIL